MAKKTSKFALVIGKAVFIRCVTFFYVGRLVENLPGYLVLEDASCIFDAGRWSQALRTGQLGEVEPFPDAVTISTGSIIDICAWDHELPRDIK